MTKARQLADLGNAYDDGALSNRNLIINGAMQVAQRGTSFTADNVYTLDRWKSGDGSGGSPARTLSQQVFTLGQTDVPNAHYYLRHAQTGASTNGNSSLVQKIEDVTRSSGQTITLSFYAKANASMTVGVRFIQDFGTGGSPSSDVTLTETITIGTSWTKFIVTKAIGSLSGKTLGTDGLHTSSLSMNMEFQPTGTFTFEIAQVQLEVGDTATPFEHKNVGQELLACQRYYSRLSSDGAAYAEFGLIAAYSSTEGIAYIQYPTTMRTSPTATQVGTFIASGDSNLAVSSFTFQNATKNGIRDHITVASGFGAKQVFRLRNNNDNDAYIEFDAEL